MENSDQIEVQETPQESNGKSIQLSDIEIKELRDIDKQAAAVKIEFANFVFTFEIQKNQYIQKIDQLQKSFEGRVHAAAVVRGINPDGDPAVMGRWNFNTNTMVFTHTPPEQISKQ